MPRHAELPAGRLIIDAAADGAWQMAVDEVLLQSAAGSQSASLRFYQWSEPTLSLGYFQGYAERELHAASRNCPLVRRQTGGGAIVHDRELTYSLALPGEVARRRRGEDWYDLVHAALIRAMARLNITAGIRGDQASPAAEDRAFLCFQRQARCDVLCGSAKVCGSAQRRRAKAVLQHGSLLLARSTWAPELPGLLELSGFQPPVEQLIALWGEELELAMGLDLRPDRLSTGELRSAETLVSEKYRHDSWNRRR
jgi:lipoate-protein ligase A